MIKSIKRDNFQTYIASKTRRFLGFTIAELVENEGQYVEVINAEIESSAPFSITFEHLNSGRIEPERVGIRLEGTSESGFIEIRFSR